MWPETHLMHLLASWYRCLNNWIHKNETNYTWWAVAHSISRATPLQHIKQNTHRIQSVKHFQCIPEIQYTGCGKSCMERQQVTWNNKIKNYYKFFTFIKVFLISHSIGRCCKNFKHNYRLWLFFLNNSRSVHKNIFWKQH